MLLKSHVKVKCIVSLVEGNANKGVLSLGVLYAQHKVATAVKSPLHCGFVADWTNCKCLVRVCIEQDYRCHLAFGDYSQLACPCRLLWPVARTVSLRAFAHWYFEHVHARKLQQRALVLVFPRHYVLVNLKPFCAERDKKPPIF